MIRKGLCTPAANGLCHIALYLNIKLLSDRCSLQFFKNITLKQGIVVLLCISPPSYSSHAQGIMYGVYS